SRKPGRGSCNRAVLAPVLGIDTGKRVGQIVLVSAGCEGSADQERHDCMEGFHRARPPKLSISKSFLYLRNSVITCSRVALPFSNAFTSVRLSFSIGTSAARSRATNSTNAKRPSSLI